MGNLWNARWWLCFLLVGLPGASTMKVDWSGVDWDQSMSNEGKKNSNLSVNSGNFSDLAKISIFDLVGNRNN